MRLRPQFNLWDLGDGPGISAVARYSLELHPTYFQMMTFRPSIAPRTYLTREAFEEIRFQAKQVDDSFRGHRVDSAIEFVPSRERFTFN
jgi:hypothetical protein